jgi:hypothetical protein
MDTPSIVIITDSIDLSRALTRHIRCALREQCTCFFSTYETRSRLSREAFDVADLFVLELFRSYGYRLRAEGLLVGGNLMGHGKRCLIMSSLSRGDALGLRVYWDLSSVDSLGNRVRSMLQDGANHASEIAQLRDEFARHCFTPAHHHPDFSG